VQRTRVLLYVIDASGGSGRDPAADLATLREEVKLWDPSLLERPALVAASKRAAASAPDPLPALERAAAAQSLRVLPISAHSGLGLPELRRALLAHVRSA